MTYELGDVLITKEDAAKPASVMVLGIVEKQADIYYTINPGDWDCNGVLEPGEILIQYLTEPYIGALDVTPVSTLESTFTKKED